MLNQNEFKSLGETFKNRRKEMNISLKEAENATSIRANYLHSIEEGDESKLISPVYAQGFLKQYAAFLGLDGEKILKENPSLFRRIETQEFSYGIGTLEMRGNPGSSVKWIPNLKWVVLSLAILTAAWYFAKFFDLF